MLRLLLAALVVMITAPAWAFPQNGILDDFTGCVDNTSPPNSNWTNAVFSGASSSTVDCEDQAVTSTSAATQAEAYYNVATYNANMEAFGTAATGFGASDRIGVCVRLVNIGANTTDGYCAVVSNTADTIGLSRFDDAAETSIHSESQVPAAGHDFGITAIGSQICLWYNTGSWVQRQCVTDTTYPNGGRLGILTIGGSSVGTLDDVGGGNVSVARGRPSFLE